MLGLLKCAHQKRYRAKFMLTLKIKVISLYLHEVMSLFHQP